LYFGPYASATALRQTLKFIHKTFKLRKCKSNAIKPRSRPCLNFQMGACLAPCSFIIDPRQYADIVTEVRLFLEGRRQALIRKIRKEMLAAAEKEDFETAASLRDKLFSFERVFEKQVVVTTDVADRDVVSIARDSRHALVLALIIREGVVQAMHQYSLKDVISSDWEMIGAFFRHFYLSSQSFPDEIIIPEKMDDVGFYEKWLADLSGKKIHIIAPCRGDKAILQHMALKNAESRLAELAADQEAKNDLLDKVQRNLKLIRYPHRIECFDNSGISGKQLVAGQVVYTDGCSDKRSYRRYSIRTIDIQDDYACMNEILNRRFKTGNVDDSFPDLLIVDGGKGQLNIAVSVLKKLGLSHRMDIISIAKGEKNSGKVHDKIYKPNRMNPVNLMGKGEVLLFLQQIRDEAHRYSIAFHRHKRTKDVTRSFLDDIAGIGRKRKNTLLTHFQSINDIKKASVDELTRLPGMNRNAANSIRDAFSKLE
jgi:excinuclease ABC subunit C